MADRSQQKNRKGSIVPKVKLTTLTGKPKMSVVFLFIAVLVAGGVGGYFVGKGQAASACVYQTFSQGSTGHCVRDIQVMYNNVSHHVGGLVGLNPYTLSVDSDYGPLTAEGITHLQQHYGIRVDGITGPGTWVQLCYENAVATGINYGKYFSDAGCIQVY